MKEASGWTRDLMAKAFDPDKPRVALIARIGRTGRSEQEGYRFLFMGAMHGIRNIEGHERSDLKSAQGGPGIARPRQSVDTTARYRRECRAGL